MHTQEHTHTELSSSDAQTAFYFNEPPSNTVSSFHSLASLPNCDFLLCLFLFKTELHTGA